MAKKRPRSPLEDSDGPGGSKRVSRYLRHRLGKLQKMSYATRAPKVVPFTNQAIVTGSERPSAVES